ncbi:hypothetical protein GA0116948_1012 [Chitinophaga costaii]|uniref:Cytochrome C biogenesis protein transmembrane region n=1 Tax=Chitinophaga costaii TaxID=1335309 RepID=A0A1C3YNP7_9BACT|nr:hypothetical protein [Chitinophaga costaii]PUZ30017.1 urease accessory protein [Chitinophaga costaii]SCB71725.1 hypothetical protein GA0116948_1012 [Chitinophaga costaii]
MHTVPLLVIMYAGLTHAFEADHLLAVSTIVSQRSRVMPALKDGMLWGLGHTSTILMIGLLMLVFKINIAAPTFSYFEAAVGLMLVSVAIYRLSKLFRKGEISVHRHEHEHSGANHLVHVHMPLEATQKNLHKASYGIGLVHGLAGSGALVVLAMTQFSTPQSGIFYLFLFGMGSVAGMLLAAALFSIPFSKKVINIPLLRNSMVLLSSGLCLVYGFYVIYHNLAA